MFRFKCLTSCSLLMCLLILAAATSKPMIVVGDGSSNIRSAPATPISASLAIDKYPLVGEVATVTCEASSIFDASDVHLSIELPAQVRLRGNTTTWQGDLEANRTQQITVDISFDEPGDMSIFCRASKVLEGGNSWGI